MARVRFRKGDQRKFISRVPLNISSPTLKELSSRIQISYSTLKNYYNESRKLPEELFRDFCFISKINPDSLNIEILDNHWGQILGGKKGKRNGPTRN